MATPVQFTIDSPCHESWQDMTPVEKGRHCLSCQKSVVDFTGMSDREILQHFANTTSGVCGRFHPDQLNRTMVARKESNFPWLKYFFQFTLPAFLVSLKSTAQDSKKQATVQVQPEQSKRFLLGDVDYQPIQQYIVKGIVKDGDGNPLPGATVMIKGTNRGTSCDTAGYFKLDCKSEEEVTLQVSYVGFERYEVGKVKPGSENLVSPVLVKMTMDIMGIVVAKPKKQKRSALEKKHSLLTPDSVKLFPNPVFVGNDINLELKIKNSGLHIVTLADYSGRAIMNTTVEATGKTLKTALTTQHLFPGNYIVTVRDRWGKIIGTKKIVIQ